MRLLLNICYDGLNYHGWQSQKNKENTIENILENVIERITGQKVCLVASGRTDAKVSAKCQYAHCDIETNIKIENLVKAINTYLPGDISINGIEQVDENFHARFNAKKKTYEYMFYISKNRNALLDRHALRVDDIDITKMQKAAQFFIGKHNFSSFCAARTQVSNFEREIYSLELSSNAGIVTMRVCGNGFLYNMVRIIAGTLLEVGIGKIEPEEVKDIIDAKDRSKAGKTLDAKALILSEVEYV